jgi:hypothetical protein
MIIPRRSKSLAAVVLGLWLMASTTAMAEISPQVVTRQGAVEGLRAKGVSEFLGIPYALPPVGELRWRPPVAAQPWKGVRRSVEFGQACAQVTTLGAFAGPANANEDCLTLNVFTPKTGASAKLPVIVWIHGGGNMDGSSRDYDATRLATLGNTVVVTINYRLGLFGWLANAALDAEGHPFGNYGLLDQQLALHWVKDNVAALAEIPAMSRWVANLPVRSIPRRMSLHHWQPGFSSGRSSRASSWTAHLYRLRSRSARTLRKRPVAAAARHRRWPLAFAVCRRSAFSSSPAPNPPPAPISAI